MAVDWSVVRPKPGDLVCPECGIVTEPYQGLVPACPTCLRILSTAVRDRKFGISYAEPLPARCNGPDRHPLTPGHVLLSWHPCQCSTSGGHRTWRCLAAPGCASKQCWPPCERDAAERYEPGWSQHPDSG